MQSAKMETEAGPTAVANELSKAPWNVRVRSDGICDLISEFEND